MQVAARLGSRNVHLRTRQPSHTRGHVVCRVSPSPPRRQKLAQGSWDLQLPSLSPLTAARWLSPFVAYAVTAYAAPKAGLTGGFLFVAPMVACAVGTYIVFATELSTAEWRAFANKTLQVEVQEMDASGAVNRISTFDTPTCEELMKSTHNDATFLKPLLMQYSEVLRGHNQDEVEVLIVWPDGELYPYRDGMELDGILRAVDKLVVKV